MVVFMKFFLFWLVVVFLAIPALAHSNEYNLSDYEQRGLYLCSTEGTVDVVAKRGDFYMIIFLDAGPISLLRNELSEKLKRKVENIPLGKRTQVLCIHPAFRDDWQE